LEPEVTGERRTLSFVGAAAWTIGAALVVDVALSVTELSRPGAALDLVNVTMCHVLAYSVMVFAMLRVYAPESSVRQVIALRGAPVLALVLAVVVGACLYPAASWLDALGAARFPTSQENNEALTKLMTSSTLARRLFLGASFVLIMPIIEEVYFRGVLFGRLRAGRTPGMVILGTAVYFAVARFDARSFASVLAFGAVLGWMRDRTRSIATTVLAQAAFFAVPVIPILRGRDPMADEVYPRAWILGGLAVAALAAAGLEGMSRAWARGKDDEEG
jgi:uncharacterized protein